MVNPDTVRNIVGIIGNVISFGLFLSPMPTFYMIWKKRAVEHFSAVPYVATLLNCMMWVLYGLPIVHPNSILVVTINGVGFVLESFYLTMFLIYSTKAQRIKVGMYLLCEIVFMAVVISCVLTLAHTHEKRSMIVGILCIIFGTCMYAAPLSVMKRVITTKSVQYMPFFLSLTNFLNGVCWSIYASIHFDINLIIPNGLGALFGAIQLILYGIYCRNKVEEMNEDVKEKEAEYGEIQMQRGINHPNTTG
ncbi:hypothetical protein AMTRI_Chr01g112820 [Amborella trichopoda]|uniref:Bidirectional sugar transporter SWEET n=1 Tax=Amborella trichopoda TaxID=13333 RepID=W1PFZ9_AMBTC|nr:bidirectional sugar transporter SWEET6b [Amborella trichopoda]ERN06624.1 hypothetical protein AMTR_s00058p00167200 [Amborella trichopoda]|eukprot:XP_006844949.1 bidirectional sugar transporter SWEET6b [Amborella trichopoda]